ncbi:MAG: ABC transporter substrate-binding protein [Armatimonadetes bacterium]|nr:ABC transporter substrate-binding protein [Armatimonadota bacterium]
MRTWRLVAIIAVALVVGASGLAVQAQERGITSTEVVIGSSMPLSGPAAYWGAVGRAIEAYSQHVNDQGGIHGRRLRVVLRDDSYLPPRAAANVRELVERAGVFSIIGLIGTANAFAVRDYVIENRVVWISPTADSSMWAGFRNKKYLFVTYPSYIHEGIMLARYGVETLKAQKIAVFYQNDLYGQKGLLGVKRGVAAMGDRAKIVAQIPYELVVTDLSGHALKLKESGADTVVLYATPRHGALIVREMVKVGYRPTLVSTFTLADPIMFVLAGEAWDNVHLGGFIPLPGHDPKVDRVIDIVSRYIPDLRRNPFNAAAGVAFLEPFLEGMRRAGRNLTRESFVTAMESIRNWDGDVVRGVTFGPERRQGLNRMYMVKTEKGKYVKLTDWITYPVEF